MKKKKTICEELKKMQKKRRRRRGGPEIRWIDNEYTSSEEWIRKQKDIYISYIQVQEEE